MLVLMAARYRASGCQQPPPVKTLVSTSYYATQKNEFPLSGSLLAVNSTNSPSP